MRKLMLLCGVALSAAFAAVPASAQALQFDLTGSRTASFILDDSIPDSFNTSALIGNQIFFNNVSGTFGGLPGTGNISFGTNLISPFQIQSANLGFTQFTGPTLFSGSPDNPTFLLGTFNFGSIVSGNSTLTISRVPAAVPEPGTWAMMLIGFGAIGIVTRRRRATLTFRRA